MSKDKKPNPKMKTIQLTDKSARIEKIETANEIVTVLLEWGGPDDKLIHDFDLDRLGVVTGSGTNGNAGRTGWVVLAGASKLNEGDEIPAL